MTFSPVEAAIAAIEANPDKPLSEIAEIEDAQEFMHSFTLAIEDYIIQKIDRRVRYEGWRPFFDSISGWRLFR